MKLLIVSLLCLSACTSTPRVETGEPRPPLNVLLITVDDMNFDSPGCYGNTMPGITPCIDQLAAQGMRFERAYVNVAICQPCRSVIMTGKYSHNNGATGFKPISDHVITMTEIFHHRGYLNGILSKVEHIEPERKFFWDYVRRQDEMDMGRNPELYYQHCMNFFKMAKDSGKPFFLMSNSQDPHRPFATSDLKLRGGGKRGSYYQKEKVRQIKETERFAEQTDPYSVELPGFLPDIENVRLEVAQYFSSVRRADRSVGRMLEALQDSGLADNTLVVFLSDHGMPLPYAKTNVYHYSNHTCMIVRWPKQIEPNSVCRHEMVSTIDLMPTILEACGLNAPGDLDGRSFVPLLKGESQTGRDYVVTQIDDIVRNIPFPMRSLQNRQYGFNFNAWSDGQRHFKNESMSGLTFKAMQEAGQEDPEIRKRVEFYLKRVPEELYDYSKDPCALKNLVDDVAHQEVLSSMRQELLTRMKQSKDPLAQSFETYLNSLQ